MNRIALVSFFISNNLGDLLISSALSDYFELTMDVDYYTLDGNRVLTETECINEINPFKRKLARFVNEIFKSKNESFPSTELNMYSDCYQAIVIGGGNMLMDLDGSDGYIDNFEKWVNYAVQKHIPIYAVSLGVGPFNTNTQVVRTKRLLERCSIVTFRDSQSMELLNYTNGNGYLSCDPVFSLASPICPKFDSPAICRKILINIINPELIGMSVNDSKIVEEKYISIATELHKRTGLDITLFCTEANDNPFARKVYKRIEFCSYVHISSCAELFDLYKTDAILIGTRMHSMIIGYTQNIPCVGLSWQNKIDGLFNSVNEPDRCFSIIESDVESIVDKVIEIINDYSNQVTKTHNECVRIRNSFLVNDIITNSILNGDCG